MYSTRFLEYAEKFKKRKVDGPKMTLIASEGVEGLYPKIVNNKNDAQLLLREINAKLQEETTFDFTSPFEEEHGCFPLEYQDASRGVDRFFGGGSTGSTDDTSQGSAARRGSDARRQARGLASMPNLQVLVPTGQTLANATQDLFCRAEQTPNANESGGLTGFAALSRELAEEENRRGSREIGVQDLALSEMLL